MTDRELVSVFWATCAAILAIWGLSALLMIGVDQQAKSERREILDELTREANEDLEAYQSLAAPDAATSPRQSTHHGPTAGDSL